MPKVPNPKPLQSVIDKYHLKVVDSLPVGITPLQFDSPQELENFLAKVRLHAQPSARSIYFDDFNNNKSLQLFTTGTSYGVVTRSCSVPAGFAQFNTWADIKVGSSGSFHWIDSVLNTRTALTGFTAALSLSNSYSYSYNQTMTSVSIKGGGTLNMWVLVNGGILLFSQPIGCQFTYRVY